MRKNSATGFHIKTYSGLLLPDVYANFLRKGWLTSFRHGNDYMKLTDSESYYDAYGSYIAGVLNQGTTKVRLAVLSDDPDVALGFSVAAEDVLHYVYVGLDYRKQGIGRSLVPQGIREITHLTRIGLELWPKKLKHTIFQPFQ